MSIKKALFGSRASVVWFSVTAALVVIMIVVTVLACGVFYGTIKSFLGSEQRIVDNSADAEKRYETDYDSKEETFAAANALNERVEEEGMVLLKNDGALPLDEGEKINVFGKNSVNLVYGGSGSAAGSTDGRRTLFESLTAAGISYNEDLVAFYEDDSRSGDPRTPNPVIENAGNVFLTTGESDPDAYGDELWRSCADESISTAVVVFSRIGGEGFDLPRTMADSTGEEAMPGARIDDHYLQLDINETALLHRIAALDNIEDIIVVINSSAPMELGFLDDPGHYAYEEKITGALWIGSPGNSGIMALGRVLAGQVNPSGRLVDTYARDFTKDPVYVNFSDNMLSEQIGRLSVTGNRYMSSETTAEPYYFVDYEEGIYVGYRYWETRGFTEGADAYTDDGILGTETTSWDSWYDAHVVYPFGYGLSYTSFSRTVDNAASLDGAALGKEKFTVSVTVTNTGDRAGKDVVEVYATSPYTAGGIEKPHKVLVGFAKTPMLYPASEAGEGRPNSAAVDITIDPYDFASYDHIDANGNGFVGYELDAGDYTISVSSDAHNAYAELTMTAPALRWSDESDGSVAADPVTGNPVENRFSDADDQLSDVTVDGKTRKGMSRSDWEGTYPTSRADRSLRIVDDAFIAELEKTDSRNPEIDGYTMPTQAASAPSQTTVQLRDLADEPYGSRRWEEFMDQLVVTDMLTMITEGAFQSPAILYAGKPLTLESDGPAGFSNFVDAAGRFYGTCYYASECVMAATWNVDLMRDVGRSIGNEGLWGNAKGDGTPYSGLYAPGANIHRSPFGGRNSEYFSEDGYLSGMMAAAEIAGAKEKGVYMYIKHFAVNEQETNRDSNGLVTWLTEQSMREIYFRPFEKAVKLGGTTAVMSSFNRIGTVWAGGDYRLLTEVLRDEWGFRGTVISDFNLTSYMDEEQMHYAGGDLNLTNTPDDYWLADTSDPHDVYVIRRCAMNVLYTVANSCAVNDVILGYLLPVWTIVLIAVEAAVLVGLAVWGFFVIRGNIKRNRER